MEEQNTGGKRRPKKFDRLSPEERKQEIRQAAAVLFAEKGFAATTMENIVERVTLSKGGVYRIYPSTEAILSDLILEGMRLRNAFYVQRVKSCLSSGRPLTMPFLADMIGESLLLYPEISAVYVEFLWEKRRNPRLEALYRSLSEESIRETTALMRQYGADEVLQSGGVSLAALTEVMNTAILGIRVLGLEEYVKVHREDLSRGICALLSRLK